MQRLIRGLGTVFCMLWWFTAAAQYNSPRNFVWAVPARLGLDFNSGSPTVITTAMPGSEACASVCDLAGNLLFYTEGDTVFNRLGAKMPNGSHISFIGANSSSQGALIVPSLTNPNQYYLFSLGGTSGGGGRSLVYSIVDMTLAGGLGDVVLAGMTTHLQDSLTERVVAIPGNNCNIWVLVQKKNAAKYYAFEVTAPGVSSSPVISFSGTGSCYDVGVLKPSHNRRSIVSGVQGSCSLLELHDFDPNTGVLSNCRVINSTEGHYGAGFSPDDSKLYAFSNNVPAGLYQYDLSLPTLSAIIASKYTIIPSGPGTGARRDIKVGPDGKMYFKGGTTAGSSILDCIAAPNVAGSGCNYIPAAINLSPGLSYGNLPNVVYDAGVYLDTIAGPETVCAGATITVTNSVPGGSWTSSTPSVATVNATTGIVTGVTAGTTIISYSKSGTCGSATETKIVTVNAAPGTITGDTLICMGGSGTLVNSVSGGSWLSGSPSIASVVSSSGLLSGNAVGTAVITYTFGSCYTTKTITVSTAPTPITGTKIVCTGNTTTLGNTSPGGTWSSSAPSIASVHITSGVVTGAAAGTAIITYNTGGCGNATTIVTVNQSPQPISGPTYICNGQTTTLTDATSGGTWSSSNTAVATIGSSSGIVAAFSQGTTTISYQASGCAAVITFAVFDNPTPITGTLNVCIGLTTVLANGAIGGTWSSGTPSVATVSASTGIVNGIAAGTATITYATGSCGSVTAVVTVNANPGAITGLLAVCSGSSTSLGNATAGGSWVSDNASTASISSSGVATGLATGTVLISYLLPTGCLTTALLTVNPAVSPISGPLAICIGQTTTLTNTSTGGSWSSANIGVATIGSASGIASGLGAGTTTVSYILSAACTASAIVTVYAIPTAGTISGTASICQGKSVTLSSTVAGGTWFSRNTGIATVISGSGIVMAIEAGIDTIDYTVSNGACSTSVSSVITVNPLPVVAPITGEPVMCIGATRTFTNSTTGGTWSVSAPSVLTIDASIGRAIASAAGSATITYTVANSFGCVKSSVYNVTVGQPSFVLHSTVSNAKCYTSSDGAIDLSITGGSGSYQYTWSTGGTSSSLHNLELGSYFVTVLEVATQCVRSDTFTISQPDSIALKLDVKKDMCRARKGSIAVFPSGGTLPYNYTWSNTAASGSNPGNLPSGVYTVTVADANGCKKERVVTVEDTICTGLIVHTAISPNGDGLNDSWVIEGIEQYSKNTVQVFDKWGDQVFGQDNYDNRWSGRNGNKGEIPDGTYYYMINLNADNPPNGKNVLTGSILIKR